MDREGFLDKGTNRLAFVLGNDGYVAVKLRINVEGFELFAEETSHMAANLTKYSNEYIHIRLLVKPSFPIMAAVISISGYSSLYQIWLHWKRGIKSGWGLFAGATRLPGLESRAGGGSCRHERISARAH